MKVLIDILSLEGCIVARNSYLLRKRIGCCFVIVDSSILRQLIINTKTILDCLTLQELGYQMVAVENRDI